MTPIVIPSLEPDDRLLKLIEQLYNAKLGPIVLVDDGSPSGGGISAILCNSRK